MRKPNPDGDVRRSKIKFQSKGNEVKCERCSDKFGEPTFFFSSHFARTGQPPLQCGRCKRQDWWVVRKKKGGA